MICKMSGVHDQGIIFPPADGMTLDRTLTVIRMSAPVHKDGSFHVEPFGSYHDYIFVEFDFAKKQGSESNYGW